MRINLNKQRRNEGRIYKNKMRQNPARTLGTMCKCPMKCYIKIPLAMRITIFNAFWGLEDFNQQNAYLFSNIQCINVKRRYGCTRADESYRQKSFIFKLKISGEDIRVCKKSFLSIHGLQNNRGRINKIQIKIKVCRVPTTDKRGKHTNRPNKISGARLASIHDHIAAIPKYQSHYSRTSNPDKAYLNCDINIASLYNTHYLKYCEEINCEPVSVDKYRRVFCQEYNIGFKLPKSDTCKTCDTRDKKMGNETDEEQNRQLSIEKELHLRYAESMKTKMKTLSLLAKENSDVHVITIDLQQTLPTPKLTCGPAFYLRKLWTFNVGIHDCGQDVGYMFLWDESQAARGSDEIGSCILKYLKLRNLEGKRLIIFSDDCCGQIKNWNITSLWTYLASSGNFDEIEHNFLISGHTNLPSDRSFGKIEKYLRAREPNIYSPDHWREVIEKCSKNKKFIVTKMEINDFFSLSNLKININTNKKVCEDGTLLKFAEVVCFHFAKDFPLQMKIKYSENAIYTEVNLKQKERSVQDVNLIPKYSAPRKINSKKVKDVLTLLPYIPVTHHNFYNNLIAEPEEPTEEKNELIG
ncbi:uncharacterized protein LOC143915302 [Arctopsyche grandis]|uniref:uncharacterized protein LOC143915302 n=1 Tax=Arctopsyche grandis TaxID=121162 RepID=UPI00406D6DE9